MPRLENSLADAETLSVDRTKPFWWRRLTDTDPISLEKLSRLRVEPFELLADGKHTYWFDGKILANYLVSTGNFLHPISRRELTREPGTWNTKLATCQIWGKARNSAFA